MSTVAAQSEAAPLDTTDGCIHSGATRANPGRGTVGLTYVAPPSDLALLFGPLYLFTSDQSQVADLTRADFAQIRFMLAGEGDYLFGDGKRVTTPRVCMLGPTNSATRFEVAGPMRVVGVAVLPLGWAALGAIDASLVADNAYDLDAQNGPQWSAIMSELEGMADPDAIAARVWVFLRTQIRPTTPSEQGFVAAADNWLADERSPQVQILQDSSGLSARQVARLCNRLYGAPPKFLARKYRALRCALILARDHIDWQDLCEGAFYDQSHFIREFKQFIGLTPNQLRDDASIVIRLTMNRRDVPGEFARLSRIS